MGSTFTQAAEEKRTPINFPETDIFLFDIDLNKTGNMMISSGENVTARKGYDNQPSFTPESKSFLYSRSGTYQTDIYEYDIESRKSRQITKTATNEFSPIVSPDNRIITYITDGAGANQNIAKLNRYKPDHSAALFPSLSLREPIGYYALNHQTGDVLFWSRYGYSVSLMQSDGKTKHFVSGHAVPSTPHIIPNTNQFSFIHRQSNGEAWIKALDTKTRSIRPLIPVVGSTENYTWTPDGAILMIEDDVLYRWMESSGQGWQDIADLSGYGIKNAARLSVSPDGKRLAVVGQAAE
ncbi:MAG: TolB family protein [Maricaulaceae bacterium]